MIHHETHHTGSEKHKWQWIGLSLGMPPTSLGTVAFSNPNPNSLRRRGRPEDTGEGDEGAEIDLRATWRGPWWWAPVKTLCTDMRERD